MAKSETKKTDAIAETPKNTEVGSVIPSWIPEGDTTGTEMAADDIRLPRLLLAQGLSPEVTPGNAKYNENVRMFDMFNDLSQEVYGKTPLKFIPLNHTVRRIEFKPRSEGGGVLDMNVPPNDPRTQWTTNEEGKRVPPRATKFHEYVVMLVRDDGLEPIMLSIKDTNKENRRAFTNLNGFIGMPTKIGNRRVQLPIYGKMYTIEPGTAQNDKGTFAVPVIKQAGILEDETLGREAMRFLKSIEGKNVVVEREGGEDEFDTAAMDAEASAAGKSSEM